MSRWIRGIYNAAANFNMSGSLRAAAGRTMGGNAEHLRQECNESDQRIKSDQSHKSSESGQHACTCHSARTCNCTNGDCADNDGECPNCKCYNCGCESRNEIRTTSCQCTACIGYAEYTNSNAARTDTGTRIRISNESRDSKLSSAHSGTDTIEHITGIRTGVTI